VTNVAQLIVWDQQSVTARGLTSVRPLRPRWNVADRRRRSGGHLH
jgi:hypothetical protein